MKVGKILLQVLLVLSPALLYASESQVIHVEFSLPYTDEDVSGYRLYHGSKIVCETENPAATSLDCLVVLPEGKAQFSLTAFFQDGSESQASALSSYTFSSTLIAVMSAIPQQGDNPLAVAFDASGSTGKIAQYQWDFGDGAVASGNPVSHTYTLSGSYNALLTVKDAAGSTAASLLPINVSGTGTAPANITPTAAISTSATVGTVPFEIQFDGTLSADSDGSITSYQWTFGDGGTASGASVKHTYLTSGTYTALLTVTDNGGLQGTISTPIIISDSPVSTNYAPIAQISVDSTQVTQGQSVAFDGAKSYDSDGKVIAYKWNFGDGYSSTAASPSHSYAIAGSYAATLTVTDDGGKEGTATTTISVAATTEPPAPPPPAGTDQTIAINFQPASAAVPDGFKADSGKDYDTAQGYGWLVEPLTSLARDRNNALSPDQAYDTLLPAAPTSVWELALADGTYTVTICIGDPSSPLSAAQYVHAEGVALVENGSVSSASPWLEKTATVEVLDGALTLTFDNTKLYTQLCWLKVTPQTLESGEEPVAFSAAVNFQPAASATPEGFLADSGTTYDATLGYGWLVAPFTNLARDRNNSLSPDQAYDTLLPAAPASVWEMDVPNGTYTLTICIGDPSSPLNAAQYVYAEGQPVLEKATVTSASPWQEKTIAVEVTDGALTLTFANTKLYTQLCWLKISSTAVEEENPPASLFAAAINFQPATAEVPVDFQADSGGDYNATLGYGWLVAPLTKLARDRNNIISPDQAYDTMLPAAPSSVWEIAVPKGSYKLTVCIGDPTSPLNAAQYVSAEGSAVFEKATVNSATPWQEKTVTVSVNDGALTLTFKNTKLYTQLCWLKIEQQ